MSAQVRLNSVNKSRKKRKMQGFDKHPIRFNKLNNV